MYSIIILQTYWQIINTFKLQNRAMPAHCALIHVCLQNLPLTLIRPNTYISYSLTRVYFPFSFPGFPHITCTVAIEGICQKEYYLNLTTTLIINKGRLGVLILLI